MRSSARVLAGAAVVVAAFAGTTVEAGAASVLRVGTFHGKKGQYTTIQAAVKKAKAGDWILVAPGDYKTTSAQTIKGANGDDRAGAAVLITTKNLHVIGMSRGGVVLDGTKSGAKCNTSKNAQFFGKKDKAGKPAGANGLIVYKVTGVTVENLTACNFLTGDQGGGNAIWFDGGASTGKQTAMKFTGSYLTATSSYFVNEQSPAAGYGIYSSNTKGGIGVFEHDYASNQNDSGYYVGACPDCSVVLNDVQAEFNVLGYSGTNSGGNVLIENSQWDNNQDGFDTNSQNNDDAPSPQSGSCPTASPSVLLKKLPAGVQSTKSCWFFVNNFVHDNNNPNVPSIGSASYGPVGTGMSISGARNNVIVGNRFVNNGAWGILLVPYPDTETPPPEAQPPCRGGTPNFPVLGVKILCYFDDFGNEITGNTFTHNGFFGNPSNGDIGEVADQSATANCFHNNTDTLGPVTTDPANLQVTSKVCGQPGAGAPVTSPLAAQAICDTQLFGPCPSAPGMVYPRVTKVKLQPLPKLASLPNPCKGAPSNPWCKGGKPI
jgi:hypothetical protein